MDKVIIAVDIMSIIISLIILFGSYFKVKLQSKKNQTFILAVSLNSILILADMISWIFDGHVEMMPFLMCVNTITFVLGFIEGYFFVEYIIIHISEQCIVSSWYLRVNKAYCVIATLSSVVACLNGSFFTFDEGWYIDGPNINIYFVMGVLSIFYVFFLGLRYFKYLGVHDASAIMSYCMFPIIAEIMNLIVHNLSLFYPAVAISSLLIYVMLQAEQQKRLYEKSNIDELTGFYNRRAYENQLKMYENTEIESDLVLVAMDVNGLKAVNDNKGHIAGDELIKGAAKCMKRCFGNNGKIFRIGGDEFIAFLFADNRQLKRIKEDFKQTVLHWSGRLVKELSISCGYVSRVGFAQMPLIELIEIADERMYKEKEKYYRDKGIDHRGQQIALSVMSQLYTKILTVDLSQDNYHILKIDAKEKKLSGTFSQSLLEFAQLGQVHKEDEKKYFRYADIDYIRKYFSEGNKMFSLYYRRLIGNAFKDVVMEIVPAPDYSNEHQWVFLYIKNIDTYRGSAEK